MLGTNDTKTNIHFSSGEYKAHMQHLIEQVLTGSIQKVIISFPIYLAEQNGAWTGWSNDRLLEYR
jgi:hypothetical protein